MARITVEDCLDRINNRFEMVLTATKRARQIANGDWSRPTKGENKYRLFLKHIVNLFYRFSQQC